MTSVKRIATAFTLFLTALASPADARPGASALITSWRITSLEASCDRGNAVACLELSGEYARACARGEGRSCSLLAAMEQTQGGTADPNQALAIYGEACSRGLREACAAAAKARAPAQRR
jgi:hypothetical protein